MNYSFTCLIALLLVFITISCKEDNPSPLPPGSKNFTLNKISVNDQPSRTKYSNVTVKPEIVLSFSEPIDHTSAEQKIILTKGGNTIPLELQFSNADTTLTIIPSDSLKFLSTYNLQVTPELASSTGKQYGSTTAITIVTQYDPSDKFPIISDSLLLDKVQAQTFKYFWDFAHPHSGMARERNTSGDIVTTGGSGFGLMALVVGVERGLISRTQLIQRLDTILTFLESADRFHGAWSHWLDGNTGKVVPFSANDNGGDLVETAFLVQGLLTVRQYLQPDDANENDVISRINQLWESVEWDWYTQGGQDVLYWHWSPDKGWIMNHKIQGYNETLITYILAASSPTHPISISVYQNGFARNGAIRNGKTFYDIVLPLGEDYGGPLFFAHYSFLGLDPRHLSDQYADYWIQNVNHTLINRAYAIDNPKNFASYSADDWGLTASDNEDGYAAHSPTNDLGVITPTAALSSFPYTPAYSMQALKFFYYKLGDRLWGDYGFYDAFNLTEGWTANSYLAIDQGPIIVMIENYRTALLWNLFMSAPEVQSGLTNLSFTY